jgi:hypothetical protein
MAAIERHGAGPHLRAILEIHRRDPDPAFPDGWTQDAFLEHVREHLARDRAPPDADAYVRARLAEAARLCERGAPEAARRIATALLMLEPNHPLADQARLLARLADERSFAERIARPATEVRRRRAAVGDRVGVRFVLTPRGAAPATIRFGLGGGRLVLDVRVRYVDVLGGEQLETRAETLELPQEIRFEPGRDWSIEWTLDSGADRPDLPTGRIYHISAWMQPAAIQGAAEPGPVRITFPRAEVRVVPREAEAMLDDPMLAFRRALEEGTVGDLCTAALLLEGEERMDAAGLLIDIFPDLDAAGQHVGYALLRFLTGKEFGRDYMRWRRWWEQLRRPP